MTPQPYDPKSGPSCGRRDCLCTHTDPCDRGWLPLPPRVLHGKDYERVAPCAVCRPQSYDRYARALEAASVRSSR